MVVSSVLFLWLFLSFPWLHSVRLPRWKHLLFLFQVNHGIVSVYPCSSSWSIGRFLSSSLCTGRIFSTTSSHWCGRVSPVWEWSISECRSGLLSCSLCRSAMFGCFAVFPMMTVWCSHFLGLLPCFHPYLLSGCFVVVVFSFSSKLTAPCCNLLLWLGIVLAIQTLFYLVLSTLW